MNPEAAREHDDPVSDAVVHLERWIRGELAAPRQIDVCLVLDALRATDDLRLELLKLKQKHARLRLALGSRKKHRIP